MSNPNYEFTIVRDAQDNSMFHIYERSKAYGHVHHVASIHEDLLADLTCQPDILQAAPGEHIPVNITMEVKNAS